jgi:hypothetical protein
MSYSLSFPKRFQPFPVNEDTVLRCQRQASAEMGRNQSKQLQPKMGRKES